MAVPPGYASIIWPASGIAMAALLQFGYRLWPGVFAGSFLLNFGISTAMDGSPVMAEALFIALMIAAGSTVQAIAGRAVIDRAMGLPINLRDKRDIVKLLLVAGPVCCVVAASLATVALAATGRIGAAEIPMHWLTWWLGDAFGVMIFMPLAMVLPGLPGRLRWKGNVLGHLPTMAMILLLLPMGMTFYAWQATVENIYEKNLSQFEVLAQESENALRRRLLSYEQALLAGVAFFRGSEHVTRAEWREYIDIINMKRNFPGISGIGYVSHLHAADIDGFLADARADGAPDFTIHPDGWGNPLFVITYIEPQAENAQAMGLNIAFEQRRRDAAIEARDSGQIIMTRKISLVQDQQGGAGFLMLAPVYAHTDSDAESGRGKEIKGWVYAPFIARNFMEHLTPSQGTLISVDIYDGAVRDEDLVFTNRNDSNKIAQARYHITKDITFNGRKWVVIWAGSPAFEKSVQSNEPLLILVVGAVFTFVLGVLLLVISQRTELIERLVDIKTREIAANEERLRVLIRHTPAAVAMFDTEMRYIMTSDRWLTDYRLEERNIIGKSHYEVFPEITDKPEWLEVHQRALKGEVINHDEDSWRRAGGVTEWVKWSIHPWRKPSGDVGGVIMFTEVITRRKLQEQALRASEEQFRSAMEGAAIGMAIVGVDGRWLRVNPALCAMLGYSSDEFMAINFQRLTHSDDLDADLSLVRDVISGKIDRYQIEKRYLRKDGGVIWALLSVSAVRESNGRVRFFISQIIDITERKEMERIKSEFIATVSHELRTPLTSIHGALGLIVGTERESLPQAILKMIEIAYRNSARLILLVNEVLDINRLESGTLKMEIEAVDVGALLPGIVEENRFFAEECGVRYVCGPMPEGAICHVDKTRLTQVVANLLSNAAKFAPQGSDVQVDCRVEGEYVCISVTDHGPGIPETFRNRIFERFAQADSSTRRRHEGTGLGLYISKQFVVAMNGQIDYRSMPDKETVFSVRFPLYTLGDRE